MKDIRGSHYWDLESDEAVLSGYKEYPTHDLAKQAAEDFATKHNLTIDWTEG